MKIFKVLTIYCLYFVASSFAQVPPWDETCETGKYPPNDPSRNVPTYVLNLDLPPEQRWVEISTKYQQPVLNLLKLFS